jgi:N-methylhydantoinase B
MNAINGYAPPNAGAFRRIRVLVRENCCVGIPRHPASCSVATCNLVDRVGNAVQRAIAELAEGYGLAEVGYSIPASLAVLSGNDPRHDDEPYIDQIVLAYTGGPGGPSADGWLTMAGLTDAGVLQWNSVELDELRFPIRIDTQRIAIDTEGAGRRRGAPAAELELTPTDGVIECMYLSDGTINPPLGVRGGGPGATARQATRGSDGVARDTGLCARLRLRPGTTLVSRCCGGGGYGDPLEREPGRVAKDVSERIISRTRAFESYGVVLDEGCRVDPRATERQRAALRSSKEGRGRTPGGPSTSARLSQGEDQRVGQR